MRLSVSPSSCDGWHISLLCRFVPNVGGVYLKRASNKDPSDLRYNGHLPIACRDVLVPCYDGS